MQTVYHFIGPRSLTPDSKFERLGLTFVVQMLSLILQSATYVHRLTARDVRMLDA